MPFLLSSDKTVINAVDQAAWSPGKDLIACLTQDSQLHAYREFPSFQRIWALSFQSEPTAMCWRPDGVHLAVGHEDGSISIIDAENGNTEMQVRECDVNPVTACARSRSANHESGILTADSSSDAADRLSSLDVCSSETGLPS